MIDVKRYKKTVHVEDVIPSVIEPSFGKNMEKILNMVIVRLTVSNLYFISYCFQLSIGLLIL